MIRIKVENIDGRLTPVELVKSAGFGIMFNGSEWLVFESREEAEENTPEIEVGNTSDNTVLNLLESMSPEGILRLKELLK